MIPCEIRCTGLKALNGSWKTIGTSPRYQSRSLRERSALQRTAAVVDLAAGRLVDPRQQPRDRALAAAALTDERDDLPLADREVEVVDGVQRLLGEQPADAEVAGQVDRAQQRLVGSPARVGSG